MNINPNTFWNGYRDPQTTGEFKGKLKLIVLLESDQTPAIKRDKAANILEGGKTAFNPRKTTYGF